jgi:hypothetical protein
LIDYFGADSKKTSAAGDYFFPILLLPSCTQSRHFPTPPPRPIFTPLFQEEDFVPWRDKREENKKAGGMQPVVGSRFDKKQKNGLDEDVQ